MAPTILYTACLLGALGLYLLMRRGDAEPRRARAVATIGAVLGIGVFAFLAMGIAESLVLADESRRPGFFYVVFSLIAVVSAVRMITHGRPVYSALYFVLVVLSSAGLFLLLEAEFMAFALIIVYAGAILITYMFVLMLAQQSPEPGGQGQPEYDLNPREPAAGAIVGFILLALLSRMIVDGLGTLPPASSITEVRVRQWEELLSMPGRIEEFVADAVEADAAADGDFELLFEPRYPDRPNDGEVPRLDISVDGSTAVAYYDVGGRIEQLELPDAARPENVQSVGLALIAKFPVSLELAGIILLMAMFGAVILARRQIELTEDEKREAAGLPRLGHHDEPSPTGEPGPGGGPGGGDDGGNGEDAS